MIYIIGVVTLLCVYTVYAGYTNMFQGDQGFDQGFDWYRAMIYGVCALAVSVTWPVTFPIIALYKVGKYYGSIQK